jgi:hypothetical protein
VTLILPGFDSACFDFGFFLFLVLIRVIRVNSWLIVFDLDSR